MLFNIVSYYHVCKLLGLKMSNYKLYYCRDVIMMFLLLLFIDIPSDKYGNKTFSNINHLCFIFILI